MTRHSGEVVGFVGLGDMGQPMAVNLAKAGIDTVVCDRRPESLDAPLAAGARSVADVAELAAECSITCLCVLDDRQVLDIVLGENGILETYRRRADRERRPLIVVHSTVMPATMVTLSEAAATVGVGVLDAPVSGGREGSVAGTLTLMVSGDTADQERCRPLFDAVGRNIFSVGDAPGMGSVAKLCNNVLALTSTLALVEAMELAGAYGIAEQTIVDIANVSTGMSWFTQHWGFTDGLMEGHTLAASGEVKYLLTKDLWDAVVAGRDKRVDLVLSAVGAQAGPTLLEARRLKRADAHSIPPAQ